MIEGADRVAENFAFGLNRIAGERRFASSRWRPLKGVDGRQGKSA